MDDDVWAFLRDKTIYFHAGYPVLFCHRMFAPRTHGRTYAVDHLNGDKNDFRRSNLFAGTQSDNMRRRTAGRQLGRRGVQNSPSGRFTSMITVNRSDLYLGIFDTVEQAARAYDIASLVLFPHTKVSNYPLSDYKGIDLGERLTALLNSRRRRQEAGSEAMTLLEHVQNLGLSQSGPSKNR